MARKTGLRKKGPQDIKREKGQDSWREGERVETERPGDNSRASCSECAPTGSAEERSSLALVYQEAQSALDARR